MLLQVPVQVGLLAEATITKLALEGLLLVVDVPDVTLKVGGDAERPLAVLTLVRLLSSVGAQMPRQICRSRENFAAELASVTFFGFSRSCWSIVVPVLLMVVR